MPTWGQLLQELNQLGAQVGAQAPGTPSPYDLLRRKYLKKLTEYTGRSVIVYATSWLENGPPVEGNSLQITNGDIQGFMETCSNLDDKNLDLILTSPGGSPEAAESIMEYLRTQFEHIRVLVQRGVSSLTVDRGTMWHAGDASGAA